MLTYVVENSLLWKKGTKNTAKVSCSTPLTDIKALDLARGGNSNAIAHRPIIRVSMVGENLQGLRVPLPVHTRTAAKEWGHFPRQVQIFPKGEEEKAGDAWR